MLGALLLSGGLLALYALSALVLGPWLVFLAAPLPLFAALRATAWLSPAPELLVIQSGRDPRLLFQLRTASESGGRSTLAVEDSNGTGIGEVEVDRLRLRASAFAGLEDYLHIRGNDGVALRARASRGCGRGGVRGRARRRGGHARHRRWTRMGRAEPGRSPPPWTRACCWPRR